MRREANAGALSSTGLRARGTLSKRYVSRTLRGIVVVATILLASLGALTPAFANPASSLDNSQRAHAHAARSIHLEWPAGLAIAPNGDLYIADERLNEVFVRLPSGTLHVIAGTGTAGFSGDGGLAIDAQLRGPNALALGANGILYVDDEGNERVRAVLPNGRITTIAGTGAVGAKTINVGSKANTVAMAPSDVTIGPRDDLYLATANEVVELSASGIISSVIDLTKTPGIKMRYPACDPEAIAFDSIGNLLLGCANSRELIERRISGHYVVAEKNYRPHDFPGMAFIKSDALLVVNGEVLFGVIGDHATPLIGLKTFAHSVVCVPSGIAVSANDTIYTDCQSGDGFDTGAGLVKITPSGNIVLLRLWKEK